MRILYFLLGLLFPTYSYLGLRLAEHSTHWLILLIPFLLILTFPLKIGRNWQQHASFLAMGMLTYLTLYTLLGDIAGLLTDLWISPPLIYLLTGITLALGAVRAVVLNVKEVRIPMTIPSLNGVKVVQLSDLHIGPSIGQRYIQKVIEQVNALKPDIIVLTGDIADGEVSLYKKEAALLRDLQSRWGKFLVLGNHEAYWNANEWADLFRKMELSVLINESKEIQVQHASLLICGITDPAMGIKPDMDKFAYNFRDNQYRILLSHRPGVADKAAAIGFNLQLSGHTHGGQFFPWTLVVKLVHRYHRGLHRIGKFFVYVNQGTGSWGPLLRVGTAPEITLIKLINVEALSSKDDNAL